MDGKGKTLSMSYQGQGHGWSLFTIFHKNNTPFYSIETPFFADLVV